MEDVNPGADWEDVGSKFPDAFKFDKEGDRIEGYLLSVEQKKLFEDDDDKATVIVIRTNDGDYSVICPGHLTYLLSGVKLRRYYRIIFTGWDTMDSEGKDVKVRKFRLAHDRKRKELAKEPVAA